jgi:peptidoglycan/LPS O-acetylase OafA/YrhL
MSGGAPANWQPSLQRVAGLDGLRACAVLIVLVAHFGFHDVVPGGFGVTLFFFISGFLITRLLLSEAANQGRVDLRGFYMRRFLRLYPALLVSVVAAWLLYPMFGGSLPLADMCAALFYYANYYGNHVGFMVGTMPTHGAFQTVGVLWSLAVEEQYYLLFPLVMIPLNKRPRLAMWVFGAIAVACLLWRMRLDHLGQGARIYSSTDTRIDSILFGAWLTCALALDHQRRLLNFLQRKDVLVVSLAVILATFLWRDEYFRNTWRYTLQGLGLMSVVASVCFEGGLKRVQQLLELRLFILIGAWSYSLYVFHGHAIVIAENLFGVSYVAPLQTLPAMYFVVAIGLTLVFSLSSYYLVEKPLFGLRRRFGSRVSG